MNRPSFPSLPFPPDTPTTPNPVLESIGQMHDLHRAEVTRYREEFTTEASTAFERSEADRRAKWISDYTSRYYTEPKFLNGRTMSQDDQYRISRPPETRLQDLVDAKMFDQAARCYIVRFGATTVDQLKVGLAGYFPTTGTASITETIPPRGGVRTQQESVHATGLSPELASALRHQVRFGKITWTIPDDADVSEY
jgi:hypothetical protein